MNYNYATDKQLEDAQTDVALSLPERQEAHDEVVRRRLAAFEAAGNTPGEEE